MLTEKKVKSIKRQIRNLNETKRELCKINFTLISFYLTREGTNGGREVGLK